MLIDSVQPVGTYAGAPARRVQDDRIDFRPVSEATWTNPAGVHRLCFRSGGMLHEFRLTNDPIGQTREVRNQERER